MSAVDDIRTKIERRLGEVQEEIDSLHGALEALEQQGAVEPPPAKGRATTSRSSGRRGGATRSRRRARAAQPPVRDPELERLLAETGGVDVVELAKQTGADPGEVLARIRELERAGQVNRDS